MENNLLNKLQLLYVEARKTKNQLSMSCLGTMLGEIQNAIKNNPNESPDSLILSYCIKSKKNLLEFKPENYELEIQILENNFLPKMLSIEESNQILKELILNDDKEISKKNFGYFMGKLSKELKGKIEANFIKDYLQKNLV